MLEAAHRLGDSYQYMVPVAPTLGREVVAAAAASGAVRPALVDDSRAALLHARASVVASGTATVEAALIGNPFVVVYRLSRLSYAIARRFVRVPHVAMANLIAGRRVVPELIQREFTAEGVVSALGALLAEGAEREETIAGLRAIRARLSVPGGPGAIARTAGICIDMLRSSRACAAGSAGDEPRLPGSPAGVYPR
jgi:lipid-A-disaccharide synthase